MTGEIICRRQHLTKSITVFFVTGVQDTNWFGGNIIDAFMQVTQEPPTIMYSAMNKNRTTEIILEKGEHWVPILPADVHPFIISNFGFQSSRKADKWANVPYDVVDGLPVLKDAAAYCRCKVIDSRNSIRTHSSTVKWSIPEWARKNRLFTGTIRNP